jgi:hypothetical protein
MNLEENEARNVYTGKVQQQFNRLTEGSEQTYKIIITMFTAQDKAKPDMQNV